MAARVTLGILFGVVLAGCISDGPNAPPPAALSGFDWSALRGCDWTYYSNDELPEDDPCKPDVPFRAVMVRPEQAPGADATCSLLVEPDERRSVAPNASWSTWWRPGRGPEGAPAPGFQLGFGYAFPDQTGPLLAAYMRTYVDDDGDPMLLAWQDDDWTGFVWLPENLADPDVQWQLILADPEPVMPRKATLDVDVHVSWVAHRHIEGQRFLPVARFANDGEFYSWPFSTNPTFAFDDLRRQSGQSHARWNDHAWVRLEGDLPGNIAGTELASVFSLTMHEGNMFDPVFTCCPGPIVDPDYLVCRVMDYVPDT